MELQQKLLRTFRQQYGDLTFREMSALTGIQHTRVFRLFNGSEMKLKEYEIFNKLIEEKGMTHKRFIELARQMTAKLSDECLQELEAIFERKLRLWNYQMGAQLDYEQNQAA